MYLRDQRENLCWLVEREQFRFSDIGRTLKDFRRSENVTLLHNENGVDWQLGSSSSRLFLRFCTECVSPCFWLKFQRPDFDWNEMQIGQPNFRPDNRWTWHFPNGKSLSIANSGGGFRWIFYLVRKIMGLRTHGDSQLSLDKKSLRLLVGHKKLASFS